MANAAALDLTNELRRIPRAWTRAALEQCWSRSAVKGALLRGTLALILPGIYAATEHSASLIVRAHAAQLSCGPRSVLIGKAALAAWEVVDATPQIELAVPSGMKRVCPPWLRLRRMTTLPTCAHWHGIQVAMPAWAAVTAFAVAPARSRDSLIYRTVQTKRASPSDLRAVLSAMPGLPGRPHLLRVIDAAEAGCESHLEAQGLRTVFNTAEFSDFIRQHWVQTPGGPYRLDMFHAASRTAVELDGAGTHGKVDSRLYDICRDANVSSIGILTVRLSSHDVAQRTPWCREVVRSVIASRI